MVELFGSKCLATLWQQQFGVPIAHVVIEEHCHGIEVAHSILRKRVPSKPLRRLRETEKESYGQEMGTGYGDGKLSIGTAYRIEEMNPKKMVERTSISTQYGAAWFAIFY